MTTPTGLPAWSRTADHTVYGGHLDKQNYLSQGVINARTDVGAEEFVRLCEDVAVCARTAPFAVITYTCNDSSPAAPTIHSVYMMTGVRTADYAGGSPPTGFPSATRNGNGNVTFSFASSYTDAYGVSSALTIRHAEAGGHGTSAIMGGVSIGATSVQVVALNDVNAAVSNAKMTLVVF